MNLPGLQRDAILIVNHSDQAEKLERSPAGSLFNHGREPQASCRQLEQRFQLSHKFGRIHIPDSSSIFHHPRTTSIRSIRNLLRRCQHIGKTMSLTSSCSMWPETIARANDQHVGQKIKINFDPMQPILAFNVPLQSIVPEFHSLIS